MSGFQADGAGGLASSAAWIVRPAIAAAPTIATHIARLIQQLRCVIVETPCKTGWKERYNQVNDRPRIGRSSANNNPLPLPRLTFGPVGLGTIGPEAFFPKRRKQDHFSLYSGRKKNTSSEEKISARSETVGLEGPLLGGVGNPQNWPKPLKFW